MLTSHITFVEPLTAKSLPSCKKLNPSRSSISAPALSNVPISVTTPVALSIVTNLSVKPAEFAIAYNVPSASIDMPSISFKSSVPPKPLVSIII